MDLTNRLTNLPYNYYIQQDIITNEENIETNSNTLSSQLILINSNTSNINSNLGKINTNIANINILEGNQNLLQLQVNNLGTSITTNNLVVNGNATVSNELILGSNLMNVEPTILNIDSDLGSLENKVNDIEDELTGGGGINFGEVLGNAQDFLGFINDMLIGATLASYFTKDGLKDQKLLNDLAENALDNDWTGEDPEETETNEENNKALWPIYQIYKRPFAVVNRDIYASNPTRYTSKISNINQYAMGYLGNQYYSPNTLLGCSSNVEYRIGADNSMFEANAVSEHHIDTLIYRDGLQGVKSELFIDYIFAGMSNQDNINIITPPQNDYTFTMRVEGDMNLNGSLNFNSSPVIHFDDINDIVYMNNLLLSNTTDGITYQTASNDADNQNILLVKNNGGNNTLRLRRDLFNTQSEAQPNFIWSIGNDSNITGLTDFMTFHNNGLIEIDTNLRIDGDTEIFGHRYSSAGIDTDKSAYQITIDADGVNSNLVFSFETLGGNISYQNLRMEQNNITHIGSNEWDLDLSLTDLNNRVQNLQNVYQDNYIEFVDNTVSYIDFKQSNTVDYDQRIIATVAGLDITVGINSTNIRFGGSQTISYKQLNMDSNDIINLGTNNYNVHNELQDLISKTANLDSNSQIAFSNVLETTDLLNQVQNLDSNGQIDYSNILNPPTIENISNFIEFTPNAVNYIDFKQSDTDYNQRILASAGGLSIFGAFNSQNINFNGTNTIHYKPVDYNNNDITGVQDITINGIANFSNTVNFNDNSLSNMGTIILNTDADIISQGGNSSFINTTGTIRLDCDNILFNSGFGINSMAIYQGDRIDMVDKLRVDQITQLNTSLTLRSDDFNITDMSSNQILGYDTTSDNIILSKDLQLSNIKSNLLKFQNLAGTDLLVINNNNSYINFQKDIRVDNIEVDTIKPKSIGLNDSIQILGRNDTVLIDIPVYNEQSYMTIYKPIYLQDSIRVLNNSVSIMDSDGNSVLKIRDKSFQQFIQITNGTQRTITQSLFFNIFEQTTPTILNNDQSAFCQIINNEIRFYNKGYYKFEITFSLDQNITQDTYGILELEKNNVALFQTRNQIRNENNGGGLRMFNMSRIVEITETYGENGNTDNYTFDIFVANFGSGVNYTFNYCAIITKL